MPLDAHDETRKLLVHVASRLGGVEALAARLSISARVLGAYLSGKELIPDALVLRVVDLVLVEMEKRPASPPSPLRPAAQPLRDAESKDRTP
jgi:hypothetical protein